MSRVLRPARHVTDRSFRIRVFPGKIADSMSDSDDIDSGPSCDIC